MTDDDPGFQKKLADTLDRSLDDLDEDTLQQLQSIRLQAQQPTRRHWRPAVAVAASVLMMLALPWLIQKQTPATEPGLMLGENYLSVEPDMLADWDMLEAIGEVPDA